MSTEEVEVIRQDMPAVIRQRDSVLLMPVMDVETALSRLAEFQRFCGQYLQNSNDGGNDGGDYGVIPGTKKKTLFKSGADKLCEVYGLYDEYQVISSVEDWDRGLFDYVLKCLLRSRRDDSLVGTGLGSCSTFESKYHWRESQRVCPKCKAATIIKGKDDFGGGWLCWAKKGGCGAKFKDGDASIEAQTIGRIDNPDIIDAKNTALKMAKKRAKIDATIGVTRSSGTFTQDLEEIASVKPVTPAPVTAQDVTIGGPAHGSGGPAKGKGPSSPPKPAGNAPVAMVTTDDVRAALIEVQKAPVAERVIDVTETDRSEPSQEEAVFEEFTTREQQDYLRLRFKEALGMAYQPHADQLRRDFLKDRGFVKDGKGTSTVIPRVAFQAVCKDALAFARTMK